MSRAARQVAVERYAADVIVPRYEDYYRSVVEGAPALAGAGEG
jgi:hypothetical protein